MFIMENIRLQNPVTQGHEVSVRLQNLEKMSQFHVGQKVTIEPGGILWTLLSMPSWKV